MLETITFLRHAEPSPDGTITPQGKDVIVQKCARHPDFKEIDLVIFSNMKRTEETANLILDTCHIHPKKEMLSDLHFPLERSCTREVQKIVKQYSSEKVLETINMPHLSSFELDTKKAFNSLSLLIQKHAAKHVLVVGHSHVINAIGLLFSPSATILENHYFKYLEGFRIDIKETKRTLVLL